MTDIIGVLGEASVATIATTTVYTCPSGKAAKVKIMWSGKAGADSLGDLTITVNGVAIAIVLNMTTVEFLHSNSTLLVNPSTAVAPTGATALLTVAPAPFEYYLNAADTITYTIGTTDMNEMAMQVVGTEIDV
ncbi:hypothetical protein LCGC14_1966250 [marine sediment metagenome]|uniref:Uncharacterized protein n=1 Tax=marine sediment metagenome TaxID=412755 RepID=A0A0F9IA64_9ZZZZ